jgi:hypothetical protein
MDTAWWLQLGLNPKDGKKNNIAIISRMKIDNKEFDSAFLHSILR